MNLEPVDDGGVWRALADPTRRRVLDLLRDRPRTTGELAAAFPLTRFAVMKHLTVLEEASLVLVERRGRERWNALNAVPLRQAYERWMAPYAEPLAITTLRLKDAAETREGIAMTATTADSTTGAPAGSLDVRNEVTVDAPPERVFEALTRLGQWWPHRFRDGAAVVLEPHVGGRFYEDWGTGQGALYGVVGTLDRPRQLAISGPMGMRGPVACVWSVELEAVDGGRTLVRGSHRGFGDIDEDTRRGYTVGWVEVYDALIGAVAG